MNYARNAASSTVIVFIASILAAFFGYLMRIYLTRKLTPSDYGLFFSVFTFINFLVLIKGFGLDSALIKYIPEFQVQKKIEQIKNAIIFVLGFNLITFIPIALVLYLMSDFLSAYYFKSPLAGWLLLYMFLIRIAAYLKDILKAIFNAFQKMVLFSMMYFLENLFILFFIWVFFNFKKNLFSLVLAYLVSYSLLFIIFLPFFLKLYPFFKYELKISGQLTKTFFKFGTPMLLAGIGGIVLLYIDTLILTYYRPLEEVGIYNVVVPTAMLISFFGQSVVNVIFPMISQMHAEKLTGHISAGIQLLQKYSFAIVLPFALTIFSFPQLLLKTFFGSAYISGALTLQVLVIGLLFYVIAGINMSVLSAIGKPERITKIMTVGAIFNLLTNFYFIPKYGMLGAGITSLLSYFLVLVLSVKNLSKFVLVKIPLWNWIKTFFAGFVFIAVIFLMRKVLHATVYVDAFVTLSAAALVYAGLLLLFRAVSIKELRAVLGKKG